MGGFGNLISDVQAEDELSESDKDQKEIIEESDTTEEDRVAAIDTSTSSKNGESVSRYVLTALTRKLTKDGFLPPKEE